LKVIFDCYVSMQGGGLSRHMVQEVNSLEEKGYDVKFILQRKMGEFLNQISPSIDVYGLGYAGVKSYPLMIINFIKLLKMEKPDIIISHAWQVDLMVYFSTIISGEKPKFVFYYLTIVESSFLKEAFFERIRSWIIRSLIVIPYKKANQIIAVSNASKNGLVNLFGIDEKKILVIPSFWDKEKILKTANESVTDPLFNTGNKKNIIIAVGSLLPTKNFGFLIKSFALVVERIDAYLVIVGDGFQKEYLENLAEELGISNQVKLLGFQYNPSKYIKNSDIFVLSSAVEGLPLVLLEAMSIGIPIIGTNVGGIPEALEYGTCGVLVEKNDINEMAEAIIRLLSDKNLSNQMVIKGQERVKYYDPQGLLDQFHENIKNI
jgi:glycosyltransferase involved in cell wall biosynthesis